MVEEQRWCADCDQMRATCLEDLSDPARKTRRMRRAAVATDNGDPLCADCLEYRVADRLAAAGPPELDEKTLRAMALAKLIGDDH